MDSCFRSTVITWGVKSMALSLSGSVTLFAATCHVPPSPRSTGEQDIDERMCHSFQHDPPQLADGAASGVGTVAYDAGTVHVAPLGLARPVTLPGTGTTTYGELMVNVLRDEARELRRMWGCEESYIVENAGRQILRHDSPPTQSDVNEWVARARYRYRHRFESRLGEAANLERQATALADLLRAEGVHVAQTESPPPSSSSATAETPAAGTAEASAPLPGPAPSVVPYVVAGLASVRADAQKLRTQIEDHERSISTAIAKRMFESPTVHPTDSNVAYWSRRVRVEARVRDGRQAKYAEALEAQAARAQRWLSSGVWEIAAESSSGASAPAGPGAHSVTVGCVQARGPRSAPYKSARLGGRGVFGPTGRTTGCSAAGPQACDIRLLNRAGQLKKTWEDRETFVREYIAARMLRQGTRNPSAKDVRRWRRSGICRYCTQARDRLQRAQSLVDEAEALRARLEASGVAVPHLEEGGGTGPGASTTPDRPEHTLTFAELAIIKIKEEARRLRQEWGRGEGIYVAQHVAHNMLYNSDYSPTDAVLRSWQSTATKNFRRRVAAHLEKASRLEAQAVNLESELVSAISESRGPQASPHAETESDERSQAPTGQRHKRAREPPPAPPDDPGEGPSRRRPGPPALPLWFSPVTSVTVSRPSWLTMKPPTAPQPRLRSTTPLHLEGQAAAPPASAATSQASPVARVHVTEAAGARPSGVSVVRRRLRREADSSASRSESPHPHPKKKWLLASVEMSAPRPPSPHALGVSQHLPEQSKAGPAAAEPVSSVAAHESRVTTPRPLYSHWALRSLPLKKRPPRER
ncbi:KRUF family protein [Besnoitia besnoiti]|uniref:KRUF family protein n=1 Tax=Besnoitia besnoiti TaxID=94643 RepID=A0A2A9MEL7_BESBE|nr:KRUF family protein [Besnoitia besnoiti]PFH34123.1 KRUF family protein [Besnoitia besnoiti]